MFSFIFFFGVLRDLYFERDRIVVHAFKRRVLLSSRRMNGPSHDGIPAVVHVWLGGWGGGWLERKRGAFLRFPNRDAPPPSPSHLSKAFCWLIGTNHLLDGRM